MRNLLALLVVSCLIALGTIGCGRTSAQSESNLVPAEETPSVSDAASDPDASDVTVALVMKTLTNPFFVEMEKGAREAEAELDINLIVKTGAQETSIEQQIAIIKGLIEDQVDAIVIAPAGSTELVPVLKQAQDAGITIINVDNQLNPSVAAEAGLEGVPFISVDNEYGAYLSAKYVSDQITEPTKVAILEGIRTAQNAEDRKRGALRAFDENPNIEVVAQETAHWKIDEAYDVIAQIYAEHPDVGAIFCANDMMALGVIHYLEEAGRSDVLVAAYDALDEAKQAIREGKLEATIDQEAALQAYKGVYYAVRALRNEELPAETMIDVKLVTRENLD